MRVLGGSRAQPCSREGEVRAFSDAISPYAALICVVRDGPPAGASLIEWLWSNRWSRRLPGHLREDVLQSVGLTLLQRAPQIDAALRARTPWLRPGDQANRMVAAYVGTMVRHRAIDLLRRPRPVPLEGVELAEPSGLERYLDLRATVAVVDRAWQQAAATRPQVRAALDELWELTFGGGSMHDLVSAHAPDATKDQRGVVRDRLFKRHRRARHMVLKCLEQMTSTGELRAERAAEAAQWLDVVVRRRAAGPTSGTHGCRRTTRVG